MWEKIWFWEHMILEHYVMYWKKSHTNPEIFIRHDHLWQVKTVPQSRYTNSQQKQSRLLAITGKQNKLQIR